MQLIKRYWTVFLIALLLCGFFFWGRTNLTNRTNESTYTTKITIGSKDLMVEVAKTPQAREQGLSDRRELCSNCGMLFIFDQPDTYAFWMRKMYFDLDMLWLNEDKVVDITYEAKKPSQEEFDAPKEIYQTRVQADKVIEVNAGWVKRNKVKVGDQLIFK